MNWLPLEKKMVENMLSIDEQGVGKICKLLVFLAMEVILIWVPFKKQMVGKWRPQRKIFQLLIPFVVEIVVTRLSLEKQVVGKWRQGRGEIGEGGSNMGRRIKMGRGAEWQALFLSMSIIYRCCAVIS